MRRADRAITDAAQIAAFLAKEQIIRIAFYDHGEIYIVPVNYGYCCENGQYRFYFHGAKAGRKYTLAQENPAVGFEIDGRYALIRSENACGHSAQFMSVIGNGTLSLLEDAEEKKFGLGCIMKQVSGTAEWQYQDEVMQKTAVFRLDVQTMTCKAK